MKMSNQHNCMLERVAATLSVQSWTNLIL